MIDEGLSVSVECEWEAKHSITAIKLGSSLFKYDEYLFLTKDARDRSIILIVIAIAAVGRRKNSIQVFYNSEAYIIVWGNDFDEP